MNIEHRTLNVESARRADSTTADATTEGRRSGQAFEGLADEVFAGGGGAEGFGDGAHSLVGFDLFVTERDQGEDGVVDGCIGGGGGVVGAGRLPCGGDTDFVFELHHDALGGFLSDAGDFRDGRDVRRHHGSLESGDIHAAEDGEGEFRADAGDVGDEEPEEVALGGGGEAKEDVGIFADLEMGEKADTASGLGEFVVA